MSEISVLFAVEAEQLLLAEMYEEAIELCNAGLNVYPEYASAYGIIARALQQLDRRTEAVEIINNAIKQFPTNRLLKTVADDIENQPLAQAQMIPQSTDNKSEFDLDDLVSSASDNNPLINNDVIFDIDSTEPDDEDNSMQTSEEILQELKEEDQEFDWAAFTSTAQSSDINIQDIDITNSKVDTEEFNIDELVNSKEVEITDAEVDAEEFNLDDLVNSQDAEVDAEEFNLDDLINSQDVEITDTEVDTEEFNLDDLVASQVEEISKTEVDAEEFNLDDLVNSQVDEITDEDVDTKDFNIDDLVNNQDVEIIDDEVATDDFDIDELVNNQDEEEIDDYETDEDTSENEALLAQLYEDIEDEDNDIEIEGHVSNDEFLTNLTTKLEIVNSALPKLAPEEEAMAQAQVYNFAESTYEDELGEIDDSIVTEVPTDDIQTEIIPEIVESNNEDESPIPEHLLEYVGLKGFASKLMYAEVMFDKKIKARNLSLIPGMDNSPIRDLRFVLKKTYSYQSLPNEPEFCVQSILPKDGQADFAGLFGFKSFQETNAHIIDSSVEEKANRTTKEVKKDIITETIANIYVLQGAYQEAIKAYSDLAEQYPDKREYFEKKISDTIAKEENNIIKE